MKSYIFLNEDGEVVACVEARNREEAESLCETSDYYKLVE